MDTAFLNNPINTAILAALAALALLVVYRIVIVKKITLGKDGILLVDSAEKSMISAIPRIDEHFKEKLRTITYDNKDIILGMMSPFPPTVRMIILYKILEEVRARIYINHFAKVLSSRENTNTWLERRTSNTLQKLQYAMDYCQIEVDRERLGAQISIAFQYFLDSFAEPTIAACHEKITCYMQYPDDEKCRENKAKNERYVRDIRQTAGIKE